jgi:Acyl-CoA dehydrogenases
MNIQLHGGIGFTWEHDAHLYLRRALTLAAFVAQTGDADRDVAQLVAAGVTRSPDLDLPPEADRYRAEARALVASLEGLDRPARRAALVESGYLVPHWPAPWGRDAGAAEQLVIEQEFRGVDVPNLGITAWVIQTIAQHGAQEQINRWVRPTLLGEIEWCQLFSEPGAGSDAAAISTRGVRAEGGWRVTGQKVWTTRAHQSDWGFATVRTDSSGSKHAGITMMAIDLRAPGVQVRPLRELTGDALFNEVFFDDVFVPDTDVVGEVGQGWRVARATLGNERVSIGGGGAGQLPIRAKDLLKLAAAAPDPHIRGTRGRHARRGGPGEAAAAAASGRACGRWYRARAGGQPQQAVLLRARAARRRARGAAGRARGGDGRQRAGDAVLPVVALHHDRGWHVGDRAQPGGGAAARPASGSADPIADVSTVMHAV